MARMGRPTILTEELIEAAWDYVDETSNMNVHVLLPTIEGLALTLHCHRDTLYAWAQENTDFSDILEELRQAQANKIMQNSMVNRYNPTISKLMLSKHGYIEQKDITSKGEKIEGTTALTEEEVNARLIKLANEREAGSDQLIGTGTTPQS